MVSATIDDASVFALANGGKLLPVLDRLGTVVGYIAPAISREEMLQKYLGLPSREEIETQVNKPGRKYTTLEVKEQLKSLETRTGTTQSSGNRSPFNNSPAYGPTQPKSEP